MERKVGSGRKGTVDEEEYLLKSITKLVGRFSTTQSKFFRIRTLVFLLITFVDRRRRAQPPPPSPSIHAGAQR